MRLNNIDCLDGESWWVVGWIAHEDTQGNSPNEEGMAQMCLGEMEGMTDGTFAPVDKTSEKRMFGPRALLLAGAAPEEQAKISALAEELPDVAVVVAHREDTETDVGSLVERAHGAGVGRASDLPRLVLMSGLTQRELHEFMAAYKETGLPRPLWAVLTPTSATWPLGSLLRELEAERQAMERATRK